MATFRYFDTSSAVSVEGDIMRLTSESELVAVYEADDGIVESTFGEWFKEFDKETVDAWKEGADEGTFLADWGQGLTALSLETGEPVEEDDAAPEAIEAEEEVEAADSEEASAE